jgi:hypothetical protein
VAAGFFFGWAGGWVASCARAMQDATQQMTTSERSEVVSLGSVDISA